jgi:hypothetical protein
MGPNAERDRPVSAADQIVYDLAQREIKSLCRRVIRHLQSMKEGYLQSGDDSPLANAWDEVCVQVQGTESFMWDAYIDTMEGIILGFFSDLPLESKKAIWLQTPEGFRWEPEEDEDQDKIPFSEDDVVQHVLYDRILRIAGNWKNKRISKYLESF